MITRYLPQEDVERTATTAAPGIVDVDGNGSFEEKVDWDDINNNESFEEEEVCWDDLPGELRVALGGDDDAYVSSIPMSNDVENYCRTMGIGERPSKPTSPVGNQNMPESESNTINTTQVLDYIPRPKGMSKTGATIGSTIGSVFSPIGVILRVLL